MRTRGGESHAAGDNRIIGRDFELGVTALDVQPVPAREGEGKKDGCWERIDREGSKTFTRTVCPNFSVRIDELFSGN